MMSLLCRLAVAWDEGVCCHGLGGASASASDVAPTRDGSTLAGGAGESPPMALALAKRIICSGAA